MTIRPRSNVLSGRGRKPTFFVDDVQRKIRRATHRLGELTSALSYPLGDIVDLLRRRLAARLRAWR